MLGGTHSPFHLQLCFLYTNLHVVIGLPMAPDVTVYFHKLPATAQGANGYHMTFTLAPPSIKLEVPNDEHVINIQVSSTSNTLKKRRARKGAKTKKSHTEGSNVNDPNTVGMAPRILPIQIMIGSIPITSGTTESVMMTSTKEKEASHPETPKVRVTRKSIKILNKESLKQKVTPRPKAMQPRILQLTSPKSDPVIKGKEVDMDIDPLKHCHQQSKVLEKV